MKTTYKVMSIFAIVLGGLAIIDSMSTEDFYAFVGGVMFISMGWMGLNLLAELKK